MIDIKLIQEDPAKVAAALEKKGYAFDFSAVLEKDALRRAKQTELEKAIDQTVMACSEMSRTKTGVLMVFERNINLDDIVRTGTELDCAVVCELLKNICFVKAPMHDGAVIVRHGRIIGGGCMLPLSKNVNLSRDLGMRHRAGIGMSENSDAIVVIVSEETGIISMAKNGVLIRRLDRQNLFNLLQEEIVPPAEDEEADISPLQKLLRKGGALNHGKPE